MGFDWEQRDQVWDKVHEEFTELKIEIDKMDADKMEAEFGDLFFSLINAARLYKINPDMPWNAQTRNSPAVSTIWKSILSKKASH